MKTNKNYTGIDGCNDKPSQGVYSTRKPSMPVTIYGVTL